MNLVIIGSSGLAREVHDMAKVCYGQNPDFKIKGFIAKDPVIVNPEKYPPFLGTVEDYLLEKDDVFFCALGNIKIRKKCVEQITEKGGKFINLIAPNVYISPSAKIGTGVMIKFNCVINSDVEIGNYTIIQGGTVLGHDVKIGSFCQINALSFFAGWSAVGDYAVINAGAKLIQKVKIGEWATVGIGSVVLRNVKPNTTVFGNPAKAVKYD
jgi:sugar O-acyltransferase (sialic acid O-acetyltransferase NeuD family)